MTIFWIEIPVGFVAPMALPALSACARPDLVFFSGSLIVRKVFSASIRDSHGGRFIFCANFQICPTPPNTLK